ncbi:hypothetical protein [Sphingomonas cavernae]|uniref:Uncharacterized protein n=1 Tax=Sphingomonas cavernae TaxID=2320861 RepID=A0A418W6S2_9SPHN|nr:hypothetical protein [Sphingomonas cavernae]RJF85743.1 hypothetical protein D3876_17820 [Sphingomonas cavernae]
MRSKMIAAATALSVLAMSPSAGAADPSGVAADTPHFVPLDRITTPIFGASRIEGELDLAVVLEASGSASAAAMRARIPEMRAASLAATLEFSRLHASGFAPVNAEQLSADLTAALKPVHPGLTRVLIVKVSALPD